MTINTIAGCVSAGYIVANNSYEYEIPDLRESTFLLTTACNMTDEEILIKLMNTQMDVNQVNSSVVTVDLPVDTLDAYIGNVCGGKNVDCGSTSAGKGFESYETSYKENVTIWMICLGNPVLNTTLSISAAFLRNWTAPVEAESSKGLSSGGIAGIVIACFVVFFFVVGLFICKGKEFCKNKTQSLPDESPRTGDLERRETGLAASNEIGHQPSNQVSGHVSPSKDLTR
jgi:hypothetical protein